MGKKNKHAVALGRLGGLAGKGSPARTAAARKAAKIRWSNLKKYQQGEELAARAEVLLRKA